MCKQETRAVLLKSIRDNFPNGEGSAMLIALILAEVNTASFAVDVSDPERFAAQIGERHPVFEKVPRRTQINQLL